MVSGFPESEAHLSWGRVHRARHRIARPSSPEAAEVALARRGELSVLPFGRGRSYGDSCLNPGGLLIETRGLDRLLAFDAARGILRAEAGVSLADLLDTLVGRPAPGGGVWCLPVSPGTRFVTLGGAIANDVHGKNHGIAGSFGRHVRAFTLLRSDRGRLECTAERNAELFRATIGGLGLTGLILEVTLELQRVDGLLLEVEDVRFDDLEGFYRLARESAGWTYTVAWVDCLARGRSLGRGIFSRARHLPSGIGTVERPRPPRFSVPFTPPVTPLGRTTLTAFNALILGRLGPAGRRVRTLPWHRFLYPLDSIGAWNRLYGPRGFWQYQCVVPPGEAPRAVARLLETIAHSGQGSFLAVLKTMGPLPSPGLLSFPMEGTTLALDFPNRGSATLELLARLDRIVLEAGGRLYPAKDGRMPVDVFRAGYPNWQRFADHVDPAFSSAFWRRVGNVDERTPAMRGAR